MHENLQGSTKALPSAVLPEPVEVELASRFAVVRIGDALSRGGHKHPLGLPGQWTLGIKA